MSRLLVEPYLIELVRRMEAEGFPLIVAGGLGLHLKRRWVGQQVREHGRKTLMAVVPEARVTSDIDVFMQMEVFSREVKDGGSVTRFRQALAGLAYQPVKGAEYFQYKRDLAEGEFVKVDLHTRLPTEGESVVVKYNKPRVGRKRQPTLKLHAYGTPEAFAIDEGSQTLPLVGLDPDGQSFSGSVRVPHPFAALCMKIQAAIDFEELPAAEQRTAKHAVKQKHAFDVYLLLAMLDLQEVDEIGVFTRAYAAEPRFARIQGGMRGIFGAPDSAGCRTIRRQAQHIAEGLELERFTAVLGELFLRG